jgi:hypothetical protein
MSEKSSSATDPTQYTNEAISCLGSNDIDCISDKVTFLT